MADCIYPYTRIPNTVIDVCNQQVASDGKTPGAYGMAIYLILARHTDSTGRCFPSLATMAKDTGLSRRLVAMIVKRLEDVGLITRERRTAKEGDHDSTLYSLPHLQGGSAPHALPSAPDAPRVVNDMHYGSAPHALGVVHQGNTNKNQLEQAPINQPAGGLFPDLPDEPKPGKPKPSKATVRPYEAEYREIIDIYPGGIAKTNQGHYERGYRNYATHRKQGSFTKEEAITYVKRYARFFEAKGWGSDRIYLISNFFGVAKDKVPYYLNHTGEEESFPTPTVDDFRMNEYIPEDSQ